MNKKELKEKLLNMLESEKECLSDNGCYWLYRWRDGDIQYISDAFNEYADDNCSIYYTDQRKAFYRNPERASDLFKEYGYKLEDFNDLDDCICRAGVCLEYQETLDNLYNDKASIIKCLIIYELINLIDNDQIFKWCHMLQAFKQLKNNIYDDKIDSFYSVDIKEYLYI